MQTLFYHSKPRRSISKIDPNVEILDIKYDTMYKEIRNKQMNTKDIENYGDFLRKNCVITLDESSDDSTDINNSDLEEDIDIDVINTDIINNSNSNDNSQYSFGFYSSFCFCFVWKQCIT